MDDMIQPPLKFLHEDDALSQTKIDRFSGLTTDELVASLKPGEPGSLKTRPDGTVLDGHHRISVLRDRGFNVDSLPREVIPQEEA